MIPRPLAENMESALESAGSREEIPSRPPRDRPSATPARDSRAVPARDTWSRYEPGAAMEAPETRAPVRAKDKVLALVIPVHNQRVTVQRGRTAFAELICAPVFPEILLPLHVALQVQRVEAA